MPWIDQESFRDGNWRKLMEKTQEDEEFEAEIEEGSRGGKRVEKILEDAAAAEALRGDSPLRG